MKRFDWLWRPFQKSTSDAAEPPVVEQQLPAIDAEPATPLLEEQAGPEPVDTPAAAVEEPPRPMLVVPLDYEEVVPRIKSREPFPWLVRLFDDQLPAMKRTWEELEPLAGLCQVPDDRVDDVSPYWNNVFFTGADAKIAYAFTRARKPSRIVEIGSGNSTRFFRKAIGEGGLSTRLVSIDPAPRVEIADIADEVMRTSIVDVPLPFFSELQPGDILFFDGSHLCFHGTDVTHFFLNVLPCVRAGVLVHIHDIPLPYEYPEHFDARYYNEQYVLGAFLLGNPEWSIRLPVHFLAQRGVLLEDGGSFWFEKSERADRLK